MLTEVYKYHAIYSFHYIVILKTCLHLLPVTIYTRHHG
jgi:hypothetical protein